MNQNDAAMNAAAAKIIFIVAGISLVIGLIVAIFYLLTLQKALNRCAPENRAMAPGLVWLMLIPLFNLVWHFFVVLNIAKSFDAEFQKRGMSEPAMPGKTIGLVMCILACCCWIPFLNLLTDLGYLVCWIIYWVQIAGYSKKLA